MSIVENLGLAYIRGKRMGLGRAIHHQDRVFFRERLAMLGLGLEDRMDQPVGLLSRRTASGADAVDGNHRNTETAAVWMSIRPHLDPKDRCCQVMELTQIRSFQEHHITTIDDHAQPAPVSGIWK